MKKTLLALSLACALLTGCADTSEKLAVIEPVTPDTTVEPQPAPPVAETPPPLENTLVQGETTPEATFAVSTITYEESACASDDPDTCLASCTYTIPHMKLAEGEENQITDAFNAGFVDWETGENFDEIFSWAQEHYDMDAAFFGGMYYTDELTCSVYQADNLVSVSGVYYSFTGGAHPNTVLMSWLFDTNTGSFVSPLTLSIDSQNALDGITALLVEQAEAKADAEGMLPQELFWENYEEVIANWPSYAVTFSADGMDVAFSPYELACYAAGPQEFHLSYDQLSDLFTPQAIETLTAGKAV